jgi:uncharacterized membrane protein YuzA (DUF378 family)
MTDFNPNDPTGVYTNALRIIYFVLSICGLMFTSILLIILSKKSKTKHSDFILTIIAVSVDCFSSGGLLFRAIFTQYPYNILREHYYWCAFDGFLNSHMLVFSGYTLSLLSAQRMLIVVFGIRFSIWIWLFVIIILAFTLFGQTIYQTVLSNFKLSVIGVFCTVNSNPIAKPFYLTVTTLTMITYILTIVSYISIILFSIKQRLNQIDLNIDKAIVYKECRAIIFRSLFYLIPYMLIYSGRVFCWIYEFSTGSKRTYTMEYVSVILISTGVVVNCLTILYMYKEVNNDFVKFIGKLKSTIYRH